MLLITQNTNWADEISIECCFIMSKELWEKYKLLIEEYAKENCLETYIGTNEEISWDNAKDYLKTFTTKKLSESQFEVLKQLKIIPINKSLGYIRTFGTSAILDDIDYEPNNTERD